eukprot:6366915-Amphidinium_carterae.1
MAETREDNQQLAKLARTGKPSVRAARTPKTERKAHKQDPLSACLLPKWVALSFSQRLLSFESRSTVFHRCEGVWCDTLCKSSALA